MNPKETTSRRLGPYMLLAMGLVLLAGVVVVSLHLADLEGFLELAREAQPLWLSAALVCQLATYLCAAGVWWVALRGIGRQVSLPGLIPLSIAKMFVDLAIPSVGVSGSLFMVTALGRRGVTEEDAMTTFAVGVGSYFIGFIVAVLISLVLISGHNGAPQSAILGGLAALGVIVATTAIGLTFLRRRLLRGQTALTRWPKLDRFLAATAQSAGEVASRPGLLAQGAGLQLGLRALDALTIWFCFLAVGAEAPLWAAFAAIVLANAAMFFAPIPMGLGTFEAGSVATLTLAGLPIEVSLTATLLFRGLSLWLPLIPGFFISQREMGRARTESEP